LSVQQAEQQISDLMIIPKASRFDKEDSQQQKLVFYKLKNHVMEFLCSQATDCFFDEV